MQITVAGKTKEVPDGIGLKELIELEKVQTPDYVIVTINDQFIDKSNEASTTVAPGDKVEFLYFMGGGR